ncbi:hypothetical protein BOO71_0002830 [Deinococcus marmoris]|uniref:Uncharacterized protein n=1 Tax=Deinococcus marmoris TaxID=249408 RepID=A0A1U7P2P1_9DEIO|nr:hypothetical protein BOO71_0002830 [Deinococcus marmoris]
MAAFVLPAELAITGNSGRLPSSASPRIHLLDRFINGSDSFDQL